MVGLGLAQYEHNEKGQEMSKEKTSSKPIVNAWATVSGGVIISIGDRLPELMAEYQGYRQKGVNLNKETGEEKPRYVYDFRLYETVEYEGKALAAGSDVSLWGSKAFECLQDIADAGLTPCPARLVNQGQISIKKGAQRYNDIQIDIPMEVQNELEKRKEDTLPLKD